MTTAGSPTNFAVSQIGMRPTEAGLNDTNPKDRDYYSFQFASGVFNRLIDGWLDVAAETERQRDVRYLKNVESDGLRAAGIIKPDEVYTPVRLIDTNIRAEQPALIQYITQSRRSIIFASPDAIPVDGVVKLEEDFTTKARYLTWEIPFIRTEDGSQAHGWDGVEIIFDPEYPGNFCIEHIGREKLIFSKDSEEIEAQEVVAIEKLLTGNQLKSLMKEGFNEEQVSKLINTRDHSLGVIDSGFKVYKVFFKQDDIINVCWYAKVCDGFLKDPQSLFLGKRDFTQKETPEIDDATGLPIDPTQVLDYLPIFETEYPIVLRRYTEGSDPRILELIGRCKMDEPAQEGASAIQSGIVNGTVRASNVYGSPKSNPINSVPNELPFLTDITLGHARMFSGPVDFWSLPPPRAEAVKFLQAVIGQNKQEQSQVDWATFNRQDSGKTATEVEAVTNKSTELSSVKVILLSIFVRTVYEKCWKIYQNRVLQGKIIIKDQSLLRLFGEGIQVDPLTGAVIACTKATYYIIKSSGDVDVVQRQQKLQQLMQSWEVLGKTPAAMVVLEDIIRLAFPEDAQRYIQALQGGTMQLVQKLAEVVKALAIDPQTGQLVPAAQPLQQQLAMLAQEVQATIATGGLTSNQPQSAQQSSQSSITYQPTQPQSVN